MWKQVKNGKLLEHIYFISTLQKFKKELFCGPPTAPYRYRRQIIKVIWQILLKKYPQTNFLQLKNLLFSKFFTQHSHIWLTIKQGRQPPLLSELGTQLIYIYIPGVHPGLGKGAYRHLGAFPFFLGFPLFLWPNKAGWKILVSNMYGSISHNGNSFAISIPLSNLVPLDH